MARHGRLAKEMKLMSKKSRPGVFLSPVGDSMEEFEASNILNYNFGRCHFLIKLML